MEFKYRAADEEPTTFPVQSSNQSYFTEQTIRAGYMGGPIHGGPGYYQNPIAMREAMWREAEKEKIREEIIAEEIARRRMLEAEVRHELMMERDLAMRRGGDGAFYSSSLQAMRFEPRGIPAPALLHRAEGRLLRGNIPMSFEERVGMSIMRKPEFGAFDSTPFKPQKITEPRISEVDPASEITKEKEKIIFLVNPETNLSGAKRKAETSLAVDTNELPSANARKKMVEEWSCAICQVTASSEHGLKDHLTGKKHKAKEVALMKNGKNYNIGLYPKKTAKPNKLEEIANNPSTKQDNVVAASESEKKTNIVLSKNQLLDAPVKKNNATVQVKQKNPKRFRFWCDMCEVGAFSEKVMEGHRIGKKHIAKLQQVNQSNEAQPPTQIVQATQELMMNLAGEACKDGENAVSENADGFVNGVKVEVHQKEEACADGDEVKLEADQKEEVDGVELEAYQKEETYADAGADN